MRSGNVSVLFLLLLLITVISNCGRHSKSETKVPLTKQSKPAGKDLTLKNSIVQNKIVVERQSLTREESDFILNVADARMMGILEGKAAVQKGSSKEIKDYGALMVKDQTTMLISLKDLSKIFSIKLPDTISKDKQDGLSDLIKRDSKKFEKRFVRMMKIDHRRDVRLFAKAQKYNNPKVKEYASRYLPLIESHLEKSKMLRKKDPKMVKSRTF